jgi:hypothetical protein
MKKLQLLIMSAVLVAGAQANAEDYAYLFDPATMTVGQTVGEFLVVNERCPKLNDTTCPANTKLKYVTAVPGRTGRLEIPVNAGNDFEISFSITDRGAGCSNRIDITITLYLSDGNSLPLGLNAGCGVGLSSPGGGGDLNANLGVNDFRLISEQGILKVGANDVFLENVKLTLSGTITRIVLSKIDEAQEVDKDGGEELLEIRTRGIQKGGSTSCPTTPTPPASDCTANYTPDNGRLIIPCVTVPVILPFGGAQTLNYSVEMQQQSGSFTFDLDLNKIVQK